MDSAAARFSFAHGGKDGFPYPVDTGTYDRTVEVLRAAVTKAGIARSERVAALKRLVTFGEEQIRQHRATGANAGEVERPDRARNGKANVDEA